MAYVAIADQKEEELHDPQTFITKYVWSQDHKVIAVQYGGTAIFVGVIALIANVICLSLISKHREGEVHMRASWIFSKNDVIANVGLILSGWLVYETGVRWPDLIVGIAIVLGIASVSP